MFHKEYNYFIKRTFSGTKYYSCTKSRITDCKARLVVKEDGEIIEKENHTCRVPSKDINTRCNLRNVEEEMKVMMEEKCIEDQSIVPNRIWQACRDEIYQKYGKEGLKMVPQGAAVG